MHPPQGAVVSWMMSSLWLIVVVGLASANMTSSTVELLEGAAFTSVIADPKSSFRDPVTSARQSDFLQSTQGLSYSHAKASSALVDISNASILPSLTSFAANHSMPSFTLGLTSGPIGSLLASPLLSNPPMGTRVSSVHSKQPIGTQLSYVSLSSPPMETAVSQQNEQISHGKHISTSTPFVQSGCGFASRVTSDQSILPQLSNTVTAGLGSSVVESASTVSHHSLLELKTTRVPLSGTVLPSPSEPLLFSSGLSAKDFISSTKTLQLTASFSLHGSSLPAMSSGLSAENFSSSTKTPQLTASLSLHASLLPAISRGLSVKDFSSFTETPQLTASLSLHASPLPAMSSGLTAEDFSSFTKTPQLTATLSLHASPQPAMSSGLTAEDFSSSTKTPQLTASLSLHANPLPAISTAIAGLSRNKPLQLMSQTERLQPSSRRLLAVTTTATVAMTTISTYPTLDQSFSTNPYWLKIDVIILEDIDIKQRDFVSAMETSLARAYSEGKARKDEQSTAVQDLLEQLNPDNDPLLNKRRKRAVSIDGNTAQLIDLSRDTNYPSNAVLVFYIAEGDTNIPAGESRAIFSELTLQELTLYLQVEVKSYPTEFIEVVVLTTTTPPDLTPLWIVLGVFGGLALMCSVCCCCFLFCCICCRPRPKSAPGGPMDVDSLKMLQHKQKYPYKTPSQTPRGFDVAKETKDAGVARETSSSGSGVPLQSSGSGSKKQFSAVTSARLSSPIRRLDADPYSSSSTSELSLHGNDLAVPPLELDSVKERTAKKTRGNEEDAFHQAMSSLELNASGRSRQSNGRLLPHRPQKGPSNDDWNLKSGRSTGRSSNRVSPHSLSTSREAQELRRIYREAQREISRVLEPDIIPDQSDWTYVAPERRPKSRGKPSKRGRKSKIQETAFGGMSSDPALPDPHYARRPTQNQTSQPEAFQEARRRVHHLIDEAFSLVGLPKNAVSPVVPLATNAPPIATDHRERTNDIQRNQTLFQRKISDSVTSSAVDIKGREFGSSPADIGRSGLDTKDVEEKPTRVVVVPVSHQPDIAAGVVWNPYNAEDELAQLHQSQQLPSYLGGVEDTQRAHQTHHLTMPHPVSIPGLTPSHQADSENKQLTHQGKLSYSQEDLMQERPSTSLRKSSTGSRMPSTGSRMLSTDSDILKLQNTAPGDPYLDPYINSGLNDELSGTYILSLHSDDPTAPQEDPYMMALLKSSNGKPQSPKPDSRRGDMLSTLFKERRVAKPVADGYDEFDVSRDVASRDKSGQLVAAIRDELVRLAKKSGQRGCSV